MRGTDVVRRVGRWLLAAAALGLLASMGAAAMLNASRAWDVGYYHLPFAARLGGLIGPEDYAFHRMNQARYEGFPLFGELLQGLFWRVTGRPEGVNLPAFLSVPLFAWFLRARFRVPFALAVVALLAVPLVHVHATSSYVDLPANVAAAVCALIAIDAWARPEPLDARSLGLAVVAAGVSANTKFQTHPVIGVALAALFARLVVDAREADPARRPSIRRATAGLVLAAPLVFATPLKNLARFGNPFYPVELRVLGHVLPGADTPYAASPAWLEHAPRPVRFAASLLELRIRPFSSTRRWTVDQWMDDADGSRVGGFFHAYVVALVVLVALHALRSRDRRTRAFALGMALLTGVVSMLPQSHELRYYLVWMLVLVATALALACRDDATPPSDRVRRFLLGKGGVLLVALAALGVVLRVTEAGYAYPSGSSFAEIAREEVSPSVLDGIRDGERVCTHKEPWAVLLAAPFHRPRRYALKEAQEPGDCSGYRALDGE